MTWVSDSPVAAPDSDAPPVALHVPDPALVASALSRDAGNPGAHLMLYCTPSPALTVQVTQFRQWVAHEVRMYDTLSASPSGIVVVGEVPVLLLMDGRVVTPADSWGAVPVPLSPPEAVATELCIAVRRGRVDTAVVAVSRGQTMLYTSSVRGKRVATR